MHSVGRTGLGHELTGEITPHSVFKIIQGSFLEEAEENWGFIAHWQEKLL